LDVAGQTNITATAYRDVQRWTCATGICQRICKAHVFDETFSVNSAFNAKVFVAAQPAAAMCFDVCSGRGGVVIGLRVVGSAEENFWLDSAAQESHNRKPDTGLVFYTSTFGLNVALWGFQ
jgi:hypothetical protein